MPVNQDRLIIGRQPLIEAIKSGKAIDKILFQKNDEEYKIDSNSKLQYVLNISKNDHIEFLINAHEL